MTARVERKLAKVMKNKEYFSCIQDLIESDPVKLMDTFIQHGHTTTLEHCINVSYLSYKVAKFFKLDYKSAARAGLLHDMFLYDWHKQPKDDRFLDQHGFSHPKKALNNALKYFELNNKEKDIIEKHMWPLTLRKVPKYKESFLVSFVDKYTSSCETVVPVAQKAGNYALLLITIFQGVFH